MRQIICACVAIALQLSASLIAHADFMITNFAVSQAPLSSDPPAPAPSSLTHLPASAEVQADENAGFENAFNFFVTRNFVGSLAEQFVNHTTIEFDRRNIPNPNNVSGFITTHFVVNTNAGPINGYYVVPGSNLFLDPNNPSIDDYVFDYSTNADVVASMQNYNNGLGTYMVIHIVQQSGGPTSVAYGDISLTGNAIPEPATLAIAAPLLIAAAFARCRRRQA